MVAMTQVFACVLMNTEILAKQRQNSSFETNNTHKCAVFWNVSNSKNVSKEKTKNKAAMKFLNLSHHRDAAHQGMRHLKRIELPPSSAIIVLRFLALLQTA